MKDEDTVLVITDRSSATRRRHGVVELKTDNLSKNINAFLNQMHEILDNAPGKLGKFQFSEFEVYAEVSAKGTLALLGTGGEVEGTGGLKFVFRRLTENSDS